MGEINYRGVLQYLEENQEIPYASPDAVGLSDEEKARYLRIKQKGQATKREMEKMAKSCEEVFGLDKCEPIKWLDGSNVKTRRYLWAQLKYKAYEKSPISVSLFVEKNGDRATYRVSLEIKNDGTDKATMEKYHSHLELPKAAGMVYVSGSNEWGNAKVIDESPAEIKRMLEAGELKKVQLSIYVAQKEDATNEYYHQQIMNAV